MKKLYKLAVLLSLTVFTLESVDARGGRGGGFGRSSSSSRGSYSKPSWFGNKNNTQQNNQPQNNYYNNHYYNNNSSNNNWWRWLFLGGLFGYGANSYAESKPTEIIDCTDEKNKSETSKDQKKECKDTEKKQEINIHDQLRTK